ncbi:MAG: hypothetical protein EP305_03270 [Bacteroidetes bacterium]|nr:MAG: hypothetical protein EP305_03270 [Bacteroidota bacterium]
MRNTLKEQHPDYHFFYFLVDRLQNGIHYEKDLVDEVIPIEQVGIPEFDALWKKYNIIELNTSVKASTFRFLISRFPETELLFYFDPDIAVLTPLDYLETQLETNEFILTPHILQPMALSEQRPNEYDFMNFGLYNLGFLGIKNTTQIRENFLPWWEERLLELCYINTTDGLFVDQHWMTLVPVLFKNAGVLKHPGLNVAPWNIQERKLTKKGGKYLINDDHEMVFYHFSSYKERNPEALFYNYERNNALMGDEVLKALYKWYHQQLTSIDSTAYLNSKCVFIQMKEAYLNELKSREKMSTREVIKGFIPPHLLNLIRKIRN